MRFENLLIIQTVYQMQAVNAPNFTYFIVLNIDFLFVI